VTAYVIRRLGLAFLSVVGASVLAFIFMRLAPGDPARATLGELATEAAVAQWRVDNGLDHGPVQQYWEFVANFVSGDWGTSFGQQAPVTELFAQRWGPTVELGVVAFVIAVVLALLIALLSTYRRRPLVDRVLSGVTFIALGTPQFWLGLVLLLLLSEQLQLLPGPSGQIDADLAPFPERTGLLLIDSLLAGRLDAFASVVAHIALPAFCLGFSVCGYLIRLLRANLLEISQEPFLMVVESKGISRWSAFARHALPNAALPTLTASGLLLGHLLTGSLLVEAVFDWPGLGGLVADAIGRKDFTVVQVFILISATGYVLVNLVVDLLYGVIDPRARVQQVEA
jgi:ABC-type dipeptide/oligopeptide/nickel transport system permease component